MNGEELRLRSAAGWRWWMGPVFSVLLAAGFVGAAEMDEPADGVRERVAELVKGLDAETRRARAEAERELLGLGPRALPHLPAPELLPNVSVRETVRRIRIELEQEAARASVRASRVTLSGSRPLRELLAEVARQSGNILRWDAVSAKQLDRAHEVEFRETPFWEALDGLVGRAGLRYEADTAADTLVVLPAGDDTAGPVAVSRSGAFRVALHSVETRPLVGSDEVELVRFRLGLTAEPRLRPLFVEFAAADVAASAPSLEKLEAFSPDAKYELPLAEGGAELDLQLDYRKPSGSDTPSASLAGRMTVLTAAGSEAIEFTDVVNAANATRRRGGVTVRVRGIESEAAGEGRRNLRVGISVGYDTGGPAFESHRTWIYHNRVYLKRPDGTRVEPDGATTTREANGLVAVEYRFDGVSGPTEGLAFVYVAPTLLIDVPVEFEFRDAAVGGAAAAAPAEDR